MLLKYVVAVRSASDIFNFLRKQPEMAILDILIYPDPRLRKIAEPVIEVDDQIRRCVDDMAQTMYAAPGIGLASIQVGIPKNIVVIDLSENRDDLNVLINPQIVDRGGQQIVEEGCLSFPGYFDEVSRSEWVRFKALGLDGEEYEKEVHGLFAACVQHELDHLNGKLFADYLSRLKQHRVKRQFEKRARTRKRAKARSAATAAV